jgi:hypothetical protein
MSWSNIVGVLGSEPINRISVGAEGIDLAIGVHRVQME